MYFKEVKGILNYEYIYLIPVFFSALVSLRKNNVRKRPVFILFSKFLLLTSFVEVFAILWEWKIHDTEWWNYSQTNIWIYNAFLTVRYVFIMTFYYNVIITSAFRKYILSLSIVFISFSIVNYFFIQTPFRVNSFSIIISHIIIAYASVVFFKEVLNKKEIIKLSSSTEVWLALGTFLYYSGTLPFFILLDKLVESESPLLIAFLFINDGLNLVMYSFYLIAYLCSPQILK